MRALVGQDETPLESSVAAPEISRQDELRPQQAHDGRTASSGRRAQHAPRARTYPQTLDEGALLSEEVAKKRRSSRNPAQRQRGPPRARVCRTGGMRKTCAARTRRSALHWLSGAGRLKIYVNESYGDFQRYDDKRTEWTIAVSQKEVDYFVWHTKIDFYNSSNSTKILRDMRINYCKGEMILHTQPLKLLTPSLRNKDTGFIDVYTMFEAPSVTVINVPSKTVVSYEFANALHKNGLDKVISSTKIELIYRNYANKEKKSNLYIEIMQIKKSEKC